MRVGVQRAAGPARLLGRIGAPQRLESEARARGGGWRLRHEDYEAGKLEGGSVPYRIYECYVAARGEARCAAGRPRRRQGMSRAQSRRTPATDRGLARGLRAGGAGRRGANDETTTPRFATRRGGVGGSALVRARCGIRKTSLKRSLPCDPLVFIPSCQHTTLRTSTVDDRSSSRHSLYRYNLCRPQAQEPRARWSQTLATTIPL